MRLSTDEDPDPLEEMRALISAIENDWDGSGDDAPLIMLDVSEARAVLQRVAEDQAVLPMRRAVKPTTPSQADDLVDLEAIIVEYRDHLRAIGSSDAGSSLLRVVRLLVDDWKHRHQSF